MKIQETFSTLKSKNEAALTVYWPLGFPSIEESKNYVRDIIQAGADIIEIGIPFSDPLADGPTIQECSQIALKNGITLEKSLEIIAELRNEGIETPIILMGYTNPFMAYGIEKLLKCMQTLEIDGLIVPDLPVAEAQEWDKSLKQHDKALIRFLSPNAKKQRMVEVTENASGFIYCIAVTGVTGARKELSSGLQSFIENVKRSTDVPASVGFGISNEEQIREVSGFADGVILASVLLKQIKSMPYETGGPWMRETIQSFKNATKRSGS